jgi:hypothetical protein
MNASGRLNTCKSRGNTGATLVATGGRVRNAYATYLKAGDILGKLRIIPHGIFGWHHLDIKDLSL